MTTESIYPELKQAETVPNGGGTACKDYFCPGETYPISRSVHLARLASFYPACRECPFRSETGQLPTKTIERLQQTERRVNRPTLFTDEGVRGIYLNELSRAKAARITAAFAALILEKTPLVGRADGESSTASPGRRNPTIVVGTDQRPSSPDIAAGVVSAIRRMGCDLIDIGPASKPCLWFNVNHLNADGGVMITGSGRDPSWTGLDFIANNGHPVSMLPNVGEQSGTLENSDSITLNRLETLAKEGVARDSRSAGGFRTSRGYVPYEAGLWKHFHALRPLRIVIGTPTRLVQRTLRRLFEKLPCQLITAEVPHRARDVNDPNDDDVRRIAEAVTNHDAHLGLLIDDDGLRVGFVDETGSHISPIDMTRLLIHTLETTERQPTFVIEREAATLIQPVVNESANEIEKDAPIVAEPGLAAISEQMDQHAALFAGGSSGRFWFRDPFPTCDAVLVLAHVLSAISRSDAPFSKVVAEVTAGCSNFTIKKNPTE
jgi:phosphomannomutase